MTPFVVRDLGRMNYQTCVDLQRDVLESVASGDSPNTLLFVEHNPVLTLGASFHEENLLYPADTYQQQGIEVIRTDRGGDVTFHGPGQLVIYPIFRIADFGRDLHKWMRDLEQTMLETLADFGVEGRRFPPHTGAWVGDAKVAAIGIKVRRWVSMHGIALNCDNALGAFDLIVPCGIHGYAVTSLSQVTGRAIGIHDAKRVVEKAFGTVFHTVVD